MTGIQLTRAQRLALALDRNLSIVAGAGTGKTQVLSERFLRILEKNRHADWTGKEVACPPGGLVAMTFTRKAAGEMRARIARTIGERIRSARAAGDADGFAYWTRMRRQLREARITTIHGICAEIVLDNALLVGIDPESTILEEVDQQILLEEAITTAMREPPEEARAALGALLIASTPRNVRAALRGLLGDRSFAERWADDMESLDDAAIIARLRDAVAPCGAEEARQRLERVAQMVTPLLDGPAPQGEKSQGFLEKCRGIIAAQNGEDDEVLEAYCHLLTLFQKKDSTSVYSEGSAHSLLGAKGEWKSTGDDRRGIDLFQSLRARILDHAEGFMGLPGEDDLELLRLMRALARTARAAEAHYSQAKRRRSALDYGDLEHLALRILETRGIAHEIRRTIRHIMVDEFQDTNDVQWRLIRLLATDDPIDPESPPPWSLETTDTTEPPLDDDGFVTAGSLFGVADDGPSVPVTPMVAPQEDVERLAATAPTHATLTDTPDLDDGPGLGHDRLFIVGDAKQSIYAFRGADVSIYQGSRTILKDANAQNDTHRRPLAAPSAKDPAVIETTEPAHPDELHGEVTLDQNFRSLPHLVAFANRLFDHILAPTQPERPAYEAEPGPLKAARCALNGDEQGQVHVLALPDKPERYHGSGLADHEALALLRQPMASFVRLAQHLDDKIRGPDPLHLQDEASARTAPERRRPARFEDVAILLPRRTQLKDLERALSARDIPYVIAGGRGFWRRPEVWDHVNLLAFLADPYRDIALAGLLRSPFFAWTDDAVVALTLDHEDGALWKKLERLADGRREWTPPQGFAGAEPQAVHRLLDDLLASQGAMPTHRLIRRIHDETAYPAALSAESGAAQCLANVEKFIGLIRDRETRQGVHLPRIVRDLERRIDDDVDEAEAAIPADIPGVRIMTVHASKGLEYPIVYLPDLARRFPDDSLGDAKGYHTGTINGTTLVSTKVRGADGEEANPILHRLITKEANARARAEQARLFYVAVTRAKDHLVFVAPSKRVLADGDKDAAPPERSEGKSWLDWLEDALGLDAAHYADALAQEDHVLRLDWKDIPLHIDATPPRPDGDAPVVPVRPADTPVIAAPSQPAIHRRPVVLHPSGIETYRVCPAKFRYRQIEALPDLHARSTDLTSPDRGRLLGTLVHRALEVTRDDEPMPPSLVARIESIAAENGFDPAGVLGDVTRHVQNARAATAGYGAPVKELVIDHTWSPGLRTRGVIDRLVQHDDGWAILDTKSDHHGKDLAEDARTRGYDAQMALYRAAVDALAKRPVVGTRLVYTSTGETLDMAPDPTVDDVRSRLEASAHAGADLDALWPTRPLKEKTCASCGFHRRWGGPCQGAAGTEPDQAVAAPLRAAAPRDGDASG